MHNGGVRASSLKALPWLGAALTVATLAWWELGGPARSQRLDREDGWAEGRAGAWARAAPRWSGAKDLGSLGYAGASEPAPQATGAVTFTPSALAPGHLLYTSGAGPLAVLIDRDGREVHRWERSWSTLDRVEPQDGPAQDTFRRALLLPDGDLVVVYGGRGLARLAPDGTPRWARSERAHHAVVLGPGGDLWVLLREARRHALLGHAEEVVDDLVARYDAKTGEPLETHSLVEALLASPAASEAMARSTRRGDFLHTNALQVLDQDLARALPGARAGQVLLTIRELDAICLLDPATGRVPWLQQGLGLGLHEAAITEGGTLLLFDNLGGPRGSAVRELTLPALEERWSWDGTPERPLRTRFCGAAHRLANGNTLVVESMRGRVLEVGGSGEVLWEFTEPRRAGAEGELVPAVFDCVLVPELPDLLRD
jgi:hypothetical protein